MVFLKWVDEMTDNKNPKLTFVVLFFASLACFPWQDHDLRHLGTQP
jgi:hypothetical protein